MVLMYGTPPDMESPRFKPVKPMEPSPVTQPMPGVQGMPPITHNPFTGEAVNIFEMLTENAVLKDEKRRLEDQVKGLNELNDSRIAEIRKLQQQAAVDRSSITTLESKLIDFETRYNTLARSKGRPELKTKKRRK
jgi:hypothetical protein